MSEENNAKAQSETDDKNTNHGRLVMITTDGSWTVWRFEFDAQDGQGVVWHQGRGMGGGNSVENSIRHFTKKGYTVVEWQSNV